MGLLSPPPFRTPDCRLRLGRATLAVGTSPNSFLRHDDGLSIERPTAKLQEADWALVRALADDGPRSSIGSWQRELTGTSRPSDGESRNSLPQASSSSDLDLASDAYAICSQALLWMSVAPTNLRDVGQALASRPEFPFVAATTGSTNLVAALVCPDDRSLYEYLTGQMTGLDGLAHIETAPVMQFVKMHATMAQRQP